MEETQKNVTLTFDLDTNRLSIYMLMQHFTKLSAAVQALSCSQSSDNAENNTAITSVASNNVSYYRPMIHCSRWEP